MTLLTFTGIKKGDRVAIYMPMINELVVAMLACARIGAVHSIVVSQFNCLLTAAKVGHKMLLKCRPLNLRGLLDLHISRRG